LNVKGRDIIVDPGTYVYTPDPEARDLFRSTRYHNAVVIDDTEQNIFYKNLPFFMQNNTRSRLLEWHDDERNSVFSGEHYGYKRLKKPVVHKRRIVFDKRESSWKIDDFFSGKGRHSFKGYYHFAPLVKVSRLDSREEERFFMSLKEKALLDDKDDGFRYVSFILEPKEGPKLLLNIGSQNEVSTKVIDGWVSCSYGIREKAQVLEFKQNETCPAQICTFIVPLEAL